MNYIVLVKQVPDITQITGNAFNPETGNLNRGALPNVINKLDADALAFANKLRQSSDGKIVCLTMGPPMAKDVLVYSLSRCADSAVLLTDRLLGGADTPATANPLAFAIRRIVKEIFEGMDNYLIISGMQSVDGDTAQVPPQVAEELDLPCIAYATDAEFVDGRLLITKIVAGGNQRVTSKRIPCMITVANYEYPIFATLERSRWASKFEVINWTAEDIRPSIFGYSGSKTRVIRVFPPPKWTRKNKHVIEINAFVSELVEDFKKGGVSRSFETSRSDYMLPLKRPCAPFNREHEGIDKEIDT